MGLHSSATPGTGSSIEVDERESAWQSCANLQNTEAEETVRVSVAF